ncbi:hypothetical protein AC579_1934 [Pseudocercospora musae]|uniref:Serine aminopeptidase S33 domain-containing protein n=1 Tax=Pseudocercospora musae TaxID=113226 RepID=A0A139I8I6_9PEZI|nr:hypothetical protein AC579_1934 [Pseudocercospora musae]
MSSYSGSSGNTKNFKVQKHKLPASHIREYPRATTDDQEEVFHLAIKQYTPVNPAAGHGKNGVTIIGGHANGFPKELYEPLWDDLYERLQEQGVHINSIWIADVSHQGDSGVLNEDILGNDPSWFDHPRDLFLMLNHFREHMKRPIIGIGHSMGGNNLVNLALMHPRLFTTLILIDPVIQRYPSVGGNFGPARASTVRRDRWSNREEAETKAKKSKMFQTWDSRVLEKWMEHGFRELPTPLYPESKTSRSLPTISADPTTSSKQPDPKTERELTLKTTKFQEVFTFLRPNFPTQEFPDPENSPNPQTHPDVPSWTSPKSPFYRPEPLFTFTRLPNLRPSVLYIFGELSDLSAPLLRADKLAQTGIGWGGSGGVEKGRVREHVFEGVGHLIPMEVVGETADVSATWVGDEVRRWKTTEEEFRREWEKIPQREKAVFSEEFKTQMLGDWIEKKNKGAGEGKSKL